MSDSLEKVSRRVVRCTLCPRLREYCLRVAREKRAAYRNEEYWGLPIPAFGDPRGRILIVGLAPAAHGGNRTGRLFTGDRSGDFLFSSLHRTGLANQPTSVRRDDGLRLRDAWLSAVVRCAPPENRPAPDEIARCLPYLAREIALLPRLRVVVALGGIAFDGVWKALALLGIPRPRPRPPFGHGTLVPAAPGRPAVLASYHPSQQNTQTGRFTAEMCDSVFGRARALANKPG